MTEEPDKKNSLKNFFRSVTVVTIFLASARVLAVFVNPGDGEHLSSLAKDPRALSMGIKVIVAGVHFLVTAFHTFNVLAYCGIILWYVAVVVPIVDQTRWEH